MQSKNELLLQCNGFERVDKSETSQKAPRKKKFIDGR